MNEKPETASLPATTSRRNTPERVAARRNRRKGTPQSEKTGEGGGQEKH